MTRDARGAHDPHGGPQRDAMADARRTTAVANPRSPSYETSTPAIVRTVRKVSRDDTLAASANCSARSFSSGAFPSKSVKKRAVAAEAPVPETTREAPGIAG